MIQEVFQHHRRSREYSMPLLAVVTTRPRMVECFECGCVFATDIPITIKDEHIDKLTHVCSACIVRQFRRKEMSKVMEDAKWASYVARTMDDKEEWENMYRAWLMSQCKQFKLKNMVYGSNNNLLRCNSCPSGIQVRCPIEIMEVE